MLSNGLRYDKIKLIPRWYILIYTFIGTFIFIYVLVLALLLAWLLLSLLVMVLASVLGAAVSTYSGFGKRLCGMTWFRSLLHLLVRLLRRDSDDASMVVTFRGARHRTLHIFWIVSIEAVRGGGSELCWLNYDVLERGLMSSLCFSSSFLFLFSKTCQRPSSILLAIASPALFSLGQPSTWRAL